MLSHIDAAQLKLLGLHELRSFGREIGVPSPTTLKKTELIDAVLKVLDGSTEAVVRSKRGRPVLSDSWSNETFGNIKAIKQPSAFILRDSGLKENFFDGALNLKAGVKNRHEAEGLLEITAAGFGILCPDGFKQSEKDIYFGREFIKNYALRSGVRVVADVYAIKENFPRAVVDVKKIDGKAPQEFLERPDFEKSEKIKKALVFDIPDKGFTSRILKNFAPAVIGGNTLILGDSCSGKSTLLCEYLNLIADMNTAVFTIMVNEPSGVLTDACMESAGALVINAFDNDRADTKGAVRLIVEAAKRAAEKGKKAIIAIDSLTRLAGIYAENGSFTDAKAFKEILELLNTASNKKCGSLSVIATVDLGGSSEETYLAQELKRYAATYIELDSRLAAMQMFPAVNLFNTLLKNADKFLNPHELETNINIRKSAFDVNILKAYDLIKKYLAE